VATARTAKESLLDSRKENTVFLFFLSLLIDCVYCGASHLKGTRQSVVGGKRTGHEVSQSIGL
jgi:hypothetical protein